MGQRLLPNVALDVTWSTLIGALSGALRALDQPVPMHHLMGLTGFAFRITLTLSDGIVAAAPAAPALDLRRALPLLENGGRDLEIIDAGTGARDFAKRRERALRALRKGIERGRPAIAYDLHLPEYGLVHGYDDRAHTLVVSTLLSSQYGSLLAESRWPVPERASPLIVLLIGRSRRVDQARALREALRFALAYAQHGDAGDPTGSAHGLDAYARWRAAFARETLIDAAGNARAIQTVLSARRDAARFLREINETHGSTASQPLHAAAAAYERVALVLSRMATLFPYPSGGDVVSAGVRRLASAGLEEAEREERAALASLEAAL